MRRFYSVFAFDRPQQQCLELSQRARGRGAETDLECICVWECVCVCVCVSVCEFVCVCADQVRRARHACKRMADEYPRTSHL